MSKVRSDREDLKTAIEVLQKAIDFAFFVHHGEGLQVCAACESEVLHIHAEDCWMLQAKTLIANRHDLENIAWSPGGYYRDNKGGVWCCVDLAVAPLKSYRMILVKANGGERPSRPSIVDWFSPDGKNISSGVHIVEGPFDHPIKESF